MKQKTINHIVRTAVTEYLNQTENRIVRHPSHIEKSFVWIDKTGRNPNAAKIGSRRIQNTWDINQCDWKNGQSLGDYVKNCNVGDVWRSKTEMLECLIVN